MSANANNCILVQSQWLMAIFEGDEDDIHTKIHKIETMTPPRIIKLMGAVLHVHRTGFSPNFNLPIL